MLHDIRYPMPEELRGKFDFVSFTHVLEHMSWRLAAAVFKNVSCLTKPGGFFLVCVPSLEYACREVIRGQFDKGVVAMIYGGQDDEYAAHLSGYTHVALEKLAKDSGFQIYSFQQTQIGIVIDGDKEGAFAGRQWELMLRRPEGLEIEVPKFVVLPEPTAEPQAPAVITKTARRNRHGKKAVS